MKSITKLVSSTIIFACASVQAEPVMNLITINTNDPAGYSAWAKGSAKALVKANNAMAMGLCSPTSGAQKMGDHYLWTFFDSQATVWANDPMNPGVAAEVWFQKAVSNLDGEREIVHGFSLVCETYAVADM
jgi:hypothetical protein